MDDGCQFIYGLYGDAEFRLRLPEKKIPVSRKQYDKDCTAVETALNTITHAYLNRLDQVFEALSPEFKKQMQPFLTKSGRELPRHSFALWLPEEFKETR